LRLFRIEPRHEGVSYFFEYVVEHLGSRDFPNELPVGLAAVTHNDESLREVTEACLRGMMEIFGLDGFLVWFGFDSVFRIHAFNMPEKMHLEKKLV
jgi:hypothetical protein